MKQGIRFAAVRGWAALAVVFAAGGGTAAAADGSAKPTPAPFYRKYLVAGNPIDDEIASMEQKVEANPNDATLRNDFGNLLALRHFPEQAAEQYEAASKLDPHDFISYYNLGMLRETEGKFSAAISAYKKSIARKPGFPPARFRLGRLYELENNDGAAVEQYAKALRIDPSMRDPKRNPLVIDSRLMYQASLTNYERDIARVTLDRDVAFVEEPGFRRVPVDRPVSAEEVAPDEDLTPREVGPSSSTSSGGGASGGAAGTTKSRTMRSSASTPIQGDSPQRTKGSRPTTGRAMRPGQPAAPAGAAAPRPGNPEAAPTPPPSASSDEPAGNDPSAPETAPEPAPTPGPASEEIEPS